MNELEQISGITARLNLLEKKNNFLRKMNLVLIILVILLPVLGFQMTNQFFKMIETEKLILKDKNGKERAVLFVDDGIAKFRLKNSKDSAMCMMGADENKGYICINDTNQFEFTILPKYAQMLSKDRLLFEIGAGGYSGYIKIYDTNDYNYYIDAKYAEISQDTTRKFSFGINDKNSSFLSFEDDNNLKKTVLSINGISISDNSLSTTISSGNIWLSKDSIETRLSPGKVELVDNEGITRIVLESTNKFQPETASIRLRDKGIVAKDDSTPFELGFGSGRTRMILMNGENNICLYLYDRNGKVRTSIGNNTTKMQDGRNIYHPESSIFLCDEEGKGLFQAPQ